MNIGNFPMDMPHGLGQTPPNHQGTMPNSDDVFLRRRVGLEAPM